jgi:hypothetical protein
LLGFWFWFLGVFGFGVGGFCWGGGFLEGGGVVGLAEFGGLFAGGSGRLGGGV